MKTVIEMAKEAGLHGLVQHRFVVEKHHQELSPKLEAFAALVRENEREACAKVCEERYMGDNNREDMEAKRCAAAIRARNSHETK